jgi:hypothetical protein
MQAMVPLQKHLRPYLKALIGSWLGTDLAGRLLDSDVVEETLLRLHLGFAEFRGQKVPESLGLVQCIAYQAAPDCKKRLAQKPIRGLHRT